MAVDTRTHVIIAQKTARRPRHDSKDAIPTIRKTKKYKPFGFSLDKAFNEEETHKVINEELGATNMIPLQKRAKTDKYRLTTPSLFSKPKYYLRSLVETIISIRKRVFGDTNQSRSDRLRNKETKLKKRMLRHISLRKRLKHQNSNIISTELIFLYIFFMFLCL